MARSNSRDDGQSAPAALKPPVDRSVCRLVVDLTKPIWVIEGALMAKPSMKAFTELLNSPSAPKAMALTSGMAFSA